MRSFLYVLARLIGDILSVLSGSVVRRIGRRAAGRASGKAMGKILK